MIKPPRIAVRGILVHENRLLLVNAWRGRFDLWCAPGGGVETHSSLPDNLIREFHEETGLDVSVGMPCLVNEFHDPKGSFHQVDVYFRCTLVGGRIDPDWQDPEGVVTHRRWVSKDELGGMNVKPDSLGAAAWGHHDAIPYDPLEPILR